MDVKSFLALAMIAALCQLGLAGPKTNKNISFGSRQFDLNVNGSIIPYQIDFLLLDYHITHLKITRNDSHSADIKVGALLQLMHGDPIVKDHGHTPYTFIEPQALYVGIDGTAELICNKPCLKNCQFAFTQVPHIKDEVPEVVKQTLLKEQLNEIMGEELCKTINKTIHHSYVKRE